MINPRQTEYKSDGDQQTPIHELLVSLRDEVTTLFTNTTALLREELGENARNVSSALKSSLIGFAVFLIGALFAVIGIDILIIVSLAPEYLSYETAAWLSTLAISVILCTAGAIFVKRHSQDITVESIIPDKTLKTLEEHGDWILSKAEKLTK